MGKKIKMMITYHPHMKNTPNLNFVILEKFKNSKYHFKIFELRKSFGKCLWVIMCMTYEQSFGLWVKT